MKRKLIGLIILVLLFMFAVGCNGSSDELSEGVEVNVSQKTEDEDSENQEDSLDLIDNDLEAAAKEEGISVKEMQNIIDSLTEIGANKYNISKEEYISRIENNGDSVFNEFKTAADFMGITISEFYEYEKANSDNLTEEEKEKMSGLANAVEEAKGTEGPALGTTDVEQMMGVEGNTSAETREVIGNAREMLSFKVGEVLQDYEDEYSILFEYSSDASSEDLVSYYEALVLNTSEYLKIVQPGYPGAMLQGTINGTLVVIDIHEYEDKMSVNTYLDLESKK
jgi:hypothetical protein